MIPDIRLANRLPYRRKTIHLTSIRSQMCIGAMRSCAIVPVGLMEDRGCLLDGAWSASTYPARMAQRMATILVFMLAVNSVCIHHVYRKIHLLQLINLHSYINSMPCAILAAFAKFPCDPLQDVDFNQTGPTSSFTAVRQVVLRINSSFSILACLAHLNSRPQTLMGRYQITNSAPSH
ncbi:hypothetical protein P692DRAFT_2032153 [Suillus brevipes Sb2]|nr:hypothetical protein P692DRAFT_2032153 [Suillus brevipes Sb2]